MRGAVFRVLVPPWIGVGLALGMALASGSLAVIGSFGMLWFLACVIGNGVPWTMLSPNGERFDRLRFLDTKSVFGWQALFPTPYTTGLLEQVFPLNNAKRGWFAGRFEADGATNGTLTANTNAVLLESLHYRAFGPMLTPTRSLTR